MAKTILQINKFEGGLVNYYDGRDLPENALHEATGVMCDVTGKVRSMGGAVIHGDFPDDFEGNFVPGYGLFAFTADHSIVSNTEKEVDVIAYQNGNFLNIYEAGSVLQSNAATSGVLLENKIKISTSGSGASEVRPVFYYIDGGLRVNDRTINNISSKYSRVFKFIDKRWFGGILESSAVYNNGGTNGYAVGPQWFSLDAPVFAPSCIANSNKGQLICNGDGFGALSTSIGDTEFAQVELSTGNIHLEVVADSGIAGEFSGDEALQFGMSFVYDDGQESPVTTFLHTDGTNALEDSSAISTAHALKFKIAVGFDGEGSVPGQSDSHKPFDPRTVGVRLYLVGDSLGIKEDPEYLAYLHFGTDTQTDPHYIESHAGDRLDSTNFAMQNTVYSNNGIKMSNFLVIKKLPALTYRHLTGVSHIEKSTAAKYKTAVVINRRAFAGGVKRLPFNTAEIVGGSFTGTVNDIYTTGNCVKQCATIWDSYDPEPDRMLISEENQFDIFPASNEIDVAINDGEQITQLMAFADRVLQFKNKTLYIINISKDVEYLESQHKYMGVEHPYQTCMTEYGPVWVNRNGCFLYDGEKITNLILGKLNPTEGMTSGVRGWYDFIGKNGMIGYIQELKQILVFQDPVNYMENNNDVTDLVRSDVMIYDLQTGSWTHGKDTISGYSKSNIIMNYDDTCMFISESVDNSESVDIYNPVQANIGTNAQWIISQVNGEWTATDTKFTIGSTDITNQFSYPLNANVGIDGVTESFGVFLERMISEKVGNDLFTFLTNSTLSIYRNASNILSTGELYANNTLTVTNAPTATYVDIAASTITKPSALHIKEGSSGGTLPDESTVNYGVNGEVSLCAPNEVSGSTWETNNSYPSCVIAYHMHIDPLSMGPEIPATTNVEKAPSFLGDSLSSYQEEGVPRYQNIGKSQIYLTKTGGGDLNAAGGDPYDGVSSVKIDLNLSHVGFHEKAYIEGHALGNNNLLDTPNNGYLEYGLSTGTGWHTNNNTTFTSINMSIPSGDLEGIVSVNEDELINGSGDLLDFESDLGGSGRDFSRIPDLDFSAVPTTINMDWQIPGVVFRVNADDMIITVLGDKSGSFTLSQDIVIANATLSGNNFGGNALILDSIDLITPFTTIVSGQSRDADLGTWNNDCYDQWGNNTCAMIDHAPAHYWGAAAKVTVLKFKKIDQSDTVQNIWTSAGTYGDHATVRFTNGVTTLAIENSGEPIQDGVAPIQGEHTLHPRRNGAVSEGLLYKLNIQGNDGFVYSDGLTTTTNLGDDDFDLALRLSNITELIHQTHPSMFSSIKVLKSDTGITNISGSGLIVKVQGNWTNYIKPGDMFEVRQAQQDGNSLARTHYRIKSVAAYSDPYTPITICSASDEIGGGADLVNAFHPVKEVDGDTASGDYSNAHVVFSIVHITSYSLSDSISALNVSGWVSLGIDINKFNNGYSSNFPQTLDVRTRDIDFGVPSSMKVFYNLIVTSKCQSPVSVQVSYDGKSSYEEIGRLDISATWIASTFYFDSVNRIPKKAHSIQVRFESVVGQVVNFELNDVTLVYRSI